MSKIMKYKVYFSDEQIQLIYDFLIDIQNRKFLDIAENDSSSAYWNVKNQVDDIIEELFIGWHHPLYELEFREFPNNSFWSVNRVTDGNCEFTSEDKETARAKCDELNSSFSRSIDGEEAIST